MNNYYEHKYFEKHKSEFHTNVFKSLEISKYLEQILKLENLILQNCHITFSNLTINITLFIYKKELSSSRHQKTIFKHENLEKLRIKMKKYYKQNKSLKPQKNRLSYLKTLFYYKNYLNSLQKRAVFTNNTENLSKKILKSLNNFTNNRFHLILTVQQINFINLKIKQTLLNFRKFERNSFFKQTKLLIMPFCTQKKSAKILGLFIAEQIKKIKRHNFFFSFLKESLNLTIKQRYSRIKGVRILIKGRLNNATRSNNRLIKIGKISLITIQSNINFFECTSYTSNGTLGIKIWICEK